MFQPHRFSPLSVVKQRFCCYHTSSICSHPTPFITGMSSDRKNQISEVLARGVEHVYPDTKALEAALRSGRKLRIYAGFDPTGKLHIGHGVIFLKLRQLQDLGHDIIVLVGGFTAKIGDPTGKRSEEHTSEL